MYSLKGTALPTRADRTIAYCIGIAHEFQARLSRMQTFVQHNPSSGSANEVILREFLAGHASTTFHVGQGFMCDPFENNKVSKQCDILVYDQSNFPLVYADGPVKIVWPESTRMIVEVKTNFFKQDIYTAIENIAAARQLNTYVTGIIFAFKSPSIDTVLKHLRQYLMLLRRSINLLLFCYLTKGLLSIAGTGHDVPT